jgi:hypothetical protein
MRLEILASLFLNILAFPTQAPEKWRRHHPAHASQAGLAAGSTKPAGLEMLRERLAATEEEIGSLPE